MLGGSLTRFRTDESYDQEGGQILKETLKGAISTRNPLKLPSNTVHGLKTGLKRGIKRKAEQALTKELGKILKKPFKLKEAVQVATALFPKQVKRARDIFGV